MNRIQTLFVTCTIVLSMANSAVIAQSTKLPCDTLLQRLEDLYKKQDLMHITGLIEQVKSTCKTEFTEKSKQYADAIGWHALIYLNFGQFKEALQLTLEQRNTYNLLQLPRDDKDYGIIQSNLAQTYISLGDWEPAKMHNDSSLSIASKLHIQNRSDHAIAASIGYRYVNKGMIIFNQAAVLPDLAKSKLDSAEMFCRKGVALLEDLKDSSIYYISGLNVLSAIIRVRGQLKDAAKFSWKAYKVAQITLGDANPLTLVSKANYAAMLIESGDKYRGEKLLAEAIQGLKKAHLTGIPSYRIMLINLANNQCLLGKYDEAEKNVELASKLPLPANLRDSAEQFSIMALVPKAVGNELEGVRWLRKAIQLFEKSNSMISQPYLLCLSNLATFYSDLGDYEESTRLIEKAIEISKILWKETTPLTIDLLNNAAHCYLNLEQYDKAEQLLLEVLTTYRKTRLKTAHVASIYENLAAFYFQKDSFQKASFYAREGLRIWKKQIGRENVDYCQMMVSSAVIERDLGNYRKADRLFREAIRLLEKGGNQQTDNYFFALTELGKFREFQGKTEEAYALFLRAWSTLQDRIQADFTFLSENGKERFLQKKEADLQNPQRLASIYHRSLPAAAGLAYDNELALKGLLLYSAQAVAATIQASGDTASLRLFNDWKSTKQLLARQYSLPARDRLVQEKILAGLLSDANRAEAQLTLQSADFYAARSPVNWQRVRDSLATGEAAVEFTRYRHYDDKEALYGALVLRPGDTLPIYVPLFEEHQLLQHLEDASGVENFKEWVAVTYLGATETRLYQLIWKPLDSLLGNTHTVYYAPAGLLHRISFPLIGQTSEQPLLQRYDLRLVGSTREVALGRKPVTAASIQSALLCGGIQYNADSLCLVQNKPRHRFDPFDLPGDDQASLATRGGCLAGAIPFLPGTLVETDRLYVRLNARFPTRLFQGCVSTEAEIKALGKNASAPGILHIATHGFFCDIPQVKAAADQLPLFRTGLLLAGAERVSMGGQPFTGMDDGILYAYEIADLNLTGTKLVVLSACETALGEIRGGEGVYGLARAFRLAGAEHVMMSLWQINDAQTVRFMETFYDKWLGGQDIHEAFRDTQRKLRQTGVGPDVWGAFVLL